MEFDPLMRKASFLHLMPRYREIFNVLFKYGFWDICQLAKLQGLLEITHLGFVEEAKKMGERPVAVRIRMAMEELGPTFIKLGQIASSRRDLVDDTLYQELRKLQSNAQPFDWKTVRQEVEETLGHSLDEVFSSFGHTPIAAASIGQVHKARLRKEKIQVAVKVRRPGIRSTVNADIEIMRHFAAFLAEHIPEAAVFDPVSIVNDLATSLRREMNFEWEAEQQREFARLFARTPGIHIPALFDDYNSENLLVSEFADGLPCDQPETLRKAGLNPHKLAEKMSRLVYRMIFEFGYFHADPHPGNIAVEEDGTILLYDFGWVGRFSDGFRESLALAIHSMVQRESSRLADSLLGMSLNGHVKDPKTLQEDLSLFLTEYLDKPLQEINLEATLNKLLEILRLHRLRMRTEFYTGVKALTQIEAIARSLHPDINYVRLGEPYAEAVLEEKYSVRKVGQTVFWSSMEFLELLKDLPLEIRNFTNRLKQGKFDIPVRHQIDPEGYQPLRSTLNHTANRLAMSLIIAALLITSGLLLHASIGPSWMGYPVMGHTTFFLGIGLALHMAWKILRRGGL
jgi:ubiquinone biosynthesis protein